MSKRILLADGAPFMRKVQKSILEKNGFNVCGEAEDGFEVIEKYEHLHPDALILGLMMTKIDSMEVLKKIKTSYPEAKIIICSSTAREKAIADAMRYGAGNFIAKPFEADSLVNIVNETLENTKLTALLDENTVKDWCAKQRNYKSDDSLSQEQVNEIVSSYYQLYSELIE